VIRANAQRLNDGTLDVDKMTNMEITVSIVNKLWERAKAGIAVPLGPVRMLLKAERSVKVSRNSYRGITGWLRRSSKKKLERPIAMNPRKKILGKNNYRRGIRMEKLPLLLVWDLVLGRP
jgi:hypothetical protein